MRKTGHRQASYLPTARIGAGRRACRTHPTGAPTCCTKRSARSRQEPSPARLNPVEDSEQLVLVCQAWALDWRWKSSAERVGSNRELKATACRDCRRETPKPWRREAVWGRSRRHAAAPNASEALDRPGRSGERAKERNARNPTEIGAVLRPGAAVHSVSLPWEICMGPRER